MLVEKTVCLAGAVLATAQLAFADVDWTTSPVVVGEGTAGLPAGKTVAGIWKFDVNGKYESADVEFRYDHVLAPKSVSLYQHDGTAWVKLASTALPNHRVKVEGVDPTKMFAAVAEKSGMIVIVQ